MATRDRYPRAIERRHQKRLRAYVDAFAPIVAEVVTARLPEIYPQPVADAEGVAVTDDLTVLNESLGELRVRWGSEVATDERIIETCKTTGAEVEAFSARSAARSLRSVGVSVVPGSYLEDLLPDWIQGHTALIVRGDTWRGIPVVPLGEQTIEQIGDVVRSGFTQGLRHEAVADEIAGRLGVMRSRANLIARDQVNKLNGAMTAERYQTAGVNEYVWRTARDERVRQSHAELEGTQWDFRTPPDIGNPGYPIQCIPSGSRLEFADGIHRAWRRRFSGDLTKIVPRLGEPVYCTPNHPVLTCSGWKPAHSVDIGDQIFHVGDEALNVGDADVENAEPAIEEVFEALGTIFSTGKMPPSLGDFHGDGSVDEDVDEVLVAWGLPDDLEPAQLKRVAHNILTETDMSLPAVPGSSDLAAVLKSFLHTPDGVVSGLSKLLSVFRACPAHSEAQRIAAASNVNAMIAKYAGDLGSPERSLVSDILGATARKILSNDPRLTELFNLATWCHESVACERVPTTVVEIGSVAVSGIHVFNLQTKNGWYQTSAILHNCRCVAEPVRPKRTR